MRDGSSRSAAKIEHGSARTQVFDEAVMPMLVAPPTCIIAVGIPFAGKLLVDRRNPVGGMFVHVLDFGNESAFLRGQILAFAAYWPFAWFAALQDYA